MKLSQAQVDKFREEGYLQLDDVLASADINPVIWEFEGIGALTSAIKIRPSQRVTHTFRASSFAVESSRSVSCAIRSG